MQLELGSSASPAQTPVSAIVTKTAYAEHYGCSLQYISKLVREKKLTSPAVLSDGRINTVLADQQLNELRDPSRPSKRKTALVDNDGLCSDMDDLPHASLIESKRTEEHSYAAERAHNEVLKRQMREIELQKLKGNLVQREDVERAAETTGRALRNKMLELPHSVAAKLIGLTSEQQIVMILREAIVEGFTEVSQEIDIDLSQQVVTIEEEIVEDADD